jgi:hypothetical protein
LAWAADKSLSDVDYQFLAASQDLDKREVLEAERQAKQILAAAQEKAEIALEEERQANQRLAQTQQKTEIALKEEKQAKQILAQAQQKTKQQMAIGATILAVSVVGAIVAAIGARQAIQARVEAQEGTILEREGVNALGQFEFEQLEALLSAMRAGQDLQELVKDKRPIEQYPAASPILALQTILDNIQEQTRLEGHQDSVESARFSPDGQRLVTTSFDNTARVWDTSGKLITELKGHQGYVRSASFSPDGQRIVTASFEKTARVWDTSGKLITELKGHQGYVRSASFSPDGQRLVTVSDGQNCPCVGTHPAS